jgi:hypothetical protein
MEMREWELWKARQQDWEREVVTRHRVALALAGQPTRTERLGQRLVWLGQRLAGWGARLQRPVGLEARR